MAATPTQRLADMLLAPDSIEAFVRTRRAEGMAWRRIAQRLYEATGGEIDVTFETLRIWYPDEAGEVPA